MNSFGRTYRFLGEPSVQVLLPKNGKCKIIQKFSDPGMEFQVHVMLAFLIFDMKYSGGILQLTYSLQGHKYLPSEI